MLAITVHYQDTGVSSACVLFLESYLTQEEVLNFCQQWIPTRYNCVYLSHTIFWDTDRDGPFPDDLESLYRFEDDFPEDYSSED